MYTEPLFETDLKKELSWRDYVKKLKIVLSTKKFERITEFMRFPLSSVDISEEALTEIYKVFEANNSYFETKIKGKNSEKITDLENKLDIVGFIKKEGKTVLKNSPNTFVVLDKDDKGEPYFLPIRNERLYDFNIKDGKVEYISFKHSETKNENGEIEERYSFYCDEYYRVFLKKDDEYIKEIENKHSIGSCPARMFMTSNVTTRDIFNKRIPLTSVLTKLEEWQTFDFYKFYTDHYLPFPVIEMIEQKCSIDGCDNGVIKTETTYLVGDVEKTRDILAACPSCESRKLTGPGTTVTLPSQSDKDDPDGRGVFRMITPDTSSLEYIAKKLDSLENFIQIKTTGKSAILEKEAVNKTQVTGSFESKENILLRLKTNFDDLYKWMICTLAKSEGVKSKDILVNADFGTEHYLKSEEDIQKRFAESKKAGLPEIETATIYQQLINTKYKTNTFMQERMKIINLIDPMPYDTLDDKIKKYTQNIVTFSELIISTKLLKFVDMFELKNGDLVSFGNSLSLMSKIEKINNQFKQYSDEYNEPKQAEPSAKPSS